MKKEITRKCQLDLPTDRREIIHIGEKRRRFYRQLIFRPASQVHLISRQQNISDTQMLSLCNRNVNCTRQQTYSQVTLQLAQVHMPTKQ